MVGGDENLLLRQAISQAIDRDEINEAVYDGSRTTSTGITPPGIPGFAEDLCEYCAYDPEAAQAAFDEWKAAGNELTEPIPIQFNAGAGHEPVVQIIVDNLAAIGIEAVAEPLPTRDVLLRAGGRRLRVLPGRLVSPTTRRTTTSCSTCSTRRRSAATTTASATRSSTTSSTRPRQTVDPDAQADLFQQAEEILLNDDIGGRADQLVPRRLRLQPGRRRRTSRRPASG